MSTDIRAISAAVIASGLAAQACDLALAGESPPFATRAAAQDYLAHALPEATAANPKYVDPASGVGTHWLTKSVTFSKDKDGGLRVRMEEDVLKYRGEKLVEQGTHDTEVPLDVTGVRFISDAWAIVDDFDAAVGIVFKCPGDPCIVSAQDGKPSVIAQTDISIADRPTLAKLHAAFRALLKSSALP